ncbi:hypothetical protein [Microseira wollei]|uniref:Uncharacterized protein n=1 Tax=Microseira wollei NIES-4236 TaxID=2530354 RepID=A0AAV3XMS5_9CYAN|nr:hypothetical protein [Microseira wollei]GET42901.1 hypothetical protein MiSe_77190 [Microseira wollei NIES-4236]
MTLEQLEAAILALPKDSLAALLARLLGYLTQVASYNYRGLVNG